MNSNKPLQKKLGVKSLVAAHQVVDCHPEGVLLKHLLCANPPKKIYKVCIHVKLQRVMSAHRHMFAAGPYITESQWVSIFLHRTRVKIAQSSNGERDAIHTRK